MSTNISLVLGERIVGTVKFDEGALTHGDAIRLLCDKLLATKEAMEKTVQGRIKMKRIFLGMTQKDVADKLGMKRETYSYIETGKRELRAKEVAKLAEIFNVTTDYILRGEEEKGAD